MGNSTTPLSALTQYDFQVIATNTFGSTTSNLVSATTTSAVTISSVTLTGTKAFTTGTNNAVVGTIAVALSTGTFNGTLSLSGADAASFQIVNVGGTNTLETNGTLNTAKTYTVNIVATQSGASNSPFTSAAQSIVGTAAVTESPAGTSVTTAGPAIINSTGQSWTLVNSGGTLGLQVAVNGAVDGTTNNVVLLYYTNHLVYQENSTSEWWSKSVSTDTWNPTTDPRVTGGPNAPAQAVSAGFTTLSFNDDFTNPGGQTTIATTKGAQSGFKWYWTFAAPDFLDPSAWSVNATQQAASVPIVTRAGPNASPNGGILKLVGIRAAGYTGVVKNAYLATCPITNTVPTLGNGVWQHCYFEAYIALDPLALGSSHPSLEAFPAFWSWGAEALAGFGDSSTLNQTGTEIDFLEDTSGVDFGGGPDPIGKNVAHVVYPNGNGVYGTGTNYPTNDSEWHTYGCLWTPNNVKFYKDNVQYGPSGGVDTTGLPLESFHQFMVLGTGIGWPIYVDWVRVWVA